MSKIKDTDYLEGIRPHPGHEENRLLTRARMDRMLEARTDDEAVKVLAECGYGEVPELAAGPGCTGAQARGRSIRGPEVANARPAAGGGLPMKYDYQRQGAASRPRPRAPRPTACSWMAGAER